MTTHTHVEEARKNQVLAALCLVALAHASLADDFLVTDRFDRVLNTHGIVLVDWEGHLANPALPFCVAPPPNASFPATATLTANGARLYFDAPSTVGSNGPTKLLDFASAASRPSFRLSIYPDRDTNDENYQLTVQWDAGGPISEVPIRVLDQDRIRSNDFSVTVSFTQDRTGFFADAAKRAIVQQAAEDWAYFIGDMHLAAVAAGDEWTFIWDTNAFTTGSWTQNAAAYTGFLLYGYALRPTSAFTPLALAGGTLPSGAVGQAFSNRLAVTGGIPLYDVEVVFGALPAGLTLDSFTGDIAGVPSAPGTNQFTVRVREYDEMADPVTATFTLVVKAPAPRLSAVPLSGGQVLLAWVPAAPVFVLQETWSLSAADWTNSPSGAINPVLVPAAPPTRFYRLFQP